MKFGIYRHYKTKNLYRVIGIAKHSETLEDLVVYECLYDNPRSKLWIRPKKMFMEKVLVNGKKIPRFKFFSMNKTLKFAPDLVPLVLSGKKDTTWRLWDDKNLTENDIVDFI